MTRRPKLPPSAARAAALRHAAAPALATPPLAAPTLATPPLAAPALATPPLAALWRPALWLPALWLAGCGGGASWDGVDEAVVRRIAEDAGRHDTGPVFAGLEGDLLLFAFLWAGLLAGFALGYFSRVLFVERADLPAGKPGGEGLRAE
ncbi:hypothetical protein [Sorangium sp. So ce1024]|uniref:hypothetical protein n=1 Tax=Sorangium sp. So ce1024 TaxID=3133327 RepID=UPI003F0CC24B